MTVFEFLACLNSLLYFELILCRVRDKDLVSIFCMWMTSFPSTTCWRGCFYSVPLVYVLFYAKTILYYCGQCYIFVFMSWNLVLQNASSFVLCAQPLLDLLCFHTYFRHTFLSLQRMSLAFYKACTNQESTLVLRYPSVFGYLPL